MPHQGVRTIFLSSRALTKPSQLVNSTMLLSNSFRRACSMSSCTDRHTHLHEMPSDKACICKLSVGLCCLFLEQTAEWRSNSGFTCICCDSFSGSACTHVVFFLSSLALPVSAPTAQGPLQPHHPRPRPPSPQCLSVPA